MRFKKANLKSDWFIGLVIMLSFLVISELGLLKSLDRHAYNLSLQFSSEKDPHEDIVDFPHEEPPRFTSENTREIV